MAHDRRIQSKWYIGLSSEKDKEERKKLVLASEKTLDILREIVYNTINSDEKKVTSSYSEPNWAYYQAHHNGRKQALQELLSILEINNLN